MPRIAVIGAGPAGLFFAHAAVEKNWKPVLFEAHSKPGGSASYFRRKKPEFTFLFDAGATLLWGLKDRQKMKELLQRWRIPLPPFQESAEIHFSLEAEERFTLKTASLTLWHESLKKAFPDDAAKLHRLIPQWHAIATDLFALLDKHPHWPIESPTDFVRDLKLLPGLLSLACKARSTLLAASFAEFLESANLSKKFCDWVDMNLLISLQARAADVHPLYGIAALNFYLLGAGALEGGMFSLFDALKTELEKKCPVHMRHEVTHIETSGEEYWVHCKQGVFGPFDRVVSSIPRFNTEKLFGRKLFADPWTFAEIEDKLWSAFMCFWGVEDHPSFPEAPFQHHIREGAFEIYVSLSARGDRLKAPAGHRTAVASSHLPLSWWKTLNEHYKEDKAHLGRLHRDVVLKRMPELKIVFEDYGSPKTFARYTRREKGFVGGFPLSHDFSLLKAPSVRSNLFGLLQIGDTSFPGQSVYSCMIGALTAVEKIASE
jgi:phytoene dehydrogenase-like protein